MIDPAVMSYEPEGGAMGLGVRNHIRMKMLGIPVKLTSETIEWEPGRRMGFRSIKPARPAIGVATHLFERCPEGSLYTWSMEFVPTGVGGRAIAGLSAALLRRNAMRSTGASAKSDRGRRQAGPTTVVAVGAELRRATRTQCGSAAVWPIGAKPQPNCASISTKFDPSHRSMICPSSSNLNASRNAVSTTLPVGSWANNHHSNARPSAVMCDGRFCRVRPTRRGRT